MLHDPDGSYETLPIRSFRVGFRRVNILAVRFINSNGAKLRFGDVRYSPTAHMIPCLRLECFLRCPALPVGSDRRHLRNIRKTRYGRLAKPYPTRTFILSETLSFS